MTLIEQYIKGIVKRYNLGYATEHTFRGDLQLLIEKLIPGISATNEPKRQLFGAPDFILTFKNIPVGYIEAKDLGDPDLEGKNKNRNKEQFDRYKNSLPNLIFTDYLDFHFYRDGSIVKTIAIGEITSNGIVSLPQNFEEFENSLQQFCNYAGQEIKSSKKLAEIMAGKAKLLSNIIVNALNSDEKTRENSSLNEQKQAFKEYLIHDLNPAGFADIYSQTVVYGMFAARLNDTSLSDFNRQTAAELIPRTNPFLRRLFQHIAGPEIDDRIKWIVDDLALIFNSCDMNEILKNYGKTTRSEDPIVHFYETFLIEYNPKLRKLRGVWYTPQPVVQFIIRAVDDILINEFDLPLGLANNETIKIEQSIDQSKDNRYKDKKKKQIVEYHKVQILDPATGTGTFLAEAVKQIHEKFEGQHGIWSEYVEKHLLPRLNGFEILMASYAMAHLKMSIVLKETGHIVDSNQRLRIYLTNSLEEFHPDTGTLWANWLSTEANEANRVKRDTPVMVVIGNPPYSGESVNKGDWIMNLMEDYKREPGGKEKLKEQNSKFINDDYVKFIRYGQHYIEKNGSGVLAYINPHGYLDNPTFRGMRWNLLKVFDKIYTIDLHGNTKKRETSPDGSKDENVFDIMQGVSINLFVKTGKNKEGDLGKVYHYDLYGLRQKKYNFLLDNSLETIAFKELSPFPNSYIFKDIDEVKFKKYNEGINPVDLFKVNVMGFQTHRDHFAIDFEMKNIKSRALDLINVNMSNSELQQKYKIKDNRDWKIDKARKEISLDQNWESKAIKCNYRPFDERSCYFSSVMMDYPRKELIQNVLNKENILLGIGRQGLAVGNIEWCLATVSKNPVDANMFRRGGVNLFPLYLYSEDEHEQLSLLEKPTRIPNLNLDVVSKIEKSLGLNFIPETDHNVTLNSFEQNFAPIDILDYIYAILHSRGYRRKYHEFLKTDFPRIPYPDNPTIFWQLVKLGSELRQIHLLEGITTNDFITRFPIGGSNNVEEVIYTNGNIFINDTQYFEGVNEKIWEFYIGGYQPVQKWIKDRKNRKLEYNDILHYQKIIKALHETDRVMYEIDKLDFL